MEIRFLTGQAALNVVGLPQFLAPNAPVAPATVNYAGLAQQGLAIAHELEFFFQAVLGQSGQGQPALRPVAFSYGAPAAPSLGAVPRQGAYAAAFGGFAAAASGGSGLPAQGQALAGGYSLQFLALLSGLQQGGMQGPFGGLQGAFGGMQGAFGGVQGAFSGLQGAFGGMQGAGAAYAGFALAAVLGTQGLNPADFNASLAYSQTERITDDPYGVSQSGQGVKSDLANSPEALLAIQAALKDKSVQSYDDLAKSLKETYGIEASVGDITIKDKEGKEHTVKGVKLGNGDYFIDGNGNGQLDAGDYKFDDAVKNLKEKYNLSDEDLKKVTEDLKTRAKTPATAPFPAQMPQVVYNPQMNLQIMVLFAQAFQLAVA